MNNILIITAWFRERRSGRRCSTSAAGSLMADEAYTGQAAPVTEAIPTTNAVIACTILRCTIPEF